MPGNAPASGRPAGRGFPCLFSAGTGPISSPEPGPPITAAMDGSYGSRIPEYVQKLRVGVEVATSTGPRLTGWIAVSPASAFHDGPESLLDRLNSGDQVFPLEGGEAGVLLVNPADVEWVKPEEGTIEELVRREAIGPTREERVRLRFRSGAELEGLLCFELPPNLNRVSDFLNGAEPFYALETMDGLFLVHKRNVCTTRLFQDSPRPGEPQLTVIEGGGPEGELRTLLQSAAPGISMPVRHAVRSLTSLPGRRATFRRTA